MYGYSRMLRRVRHSYAGGRLHIPRKGRIRFVLALVAAAGTVWFTVSRISPGQHRPVSSKPVPAQASEQPAKPAARATAKRTPPFSFFAREKAPPVLSVERHRIMLPAGFSPRLASGSDTARLNGREVVVRYAIDTSLQECAQRLMDRYRPRYGAAVAMDPATGRVLALISYTNDTVPALDNQLYCRSIFPAASVFKTVTAAAAIEKNRLTPDSPLRLVGRNHTLYRFQLKEELEVSRDVPLAEAYAYSVNPIFGRIGIFLVGSDGLRDYARRFGFLARVPFALPVDTSRLHASDSAYALAELASGFNQGTTLSPVLGCMIAAAVANGGLMMEPVLVDSILDCRNGRTLERSTPAVWRQVLDPTTALYVRVLMSKVAQYGTARSSFKYLRNSFRFSQTAYGGKTGSIDREGLGKVDWFVGFVRHATDPSQQLAVGIVTTHGGNWTVHSSFIGAELMRIRIREVQRANDREEDQQPDRAADTQETGG